MPIRLLPRLAALLLVWMACAHAGDRQGQVVSVTKGDTLVIRLDKQTQQTVRLAGIDAPELEQAHGSAARQHLSDLALGKVVRVTWSKRDALGRIIGKALTEPVPCKTPCEKTRDLGLSQLEAGMAWWARSERREQTLLDQGYYEYAEFDAKSRRIGLWLDPAPVPPWEWRKKSRVVATLSPHPSKKTTHHAPVCS